MSREIKTPFSTLFIKPEALKRILYYTDAASGEVSGLGIIEQTKNKNLIVDKVYLLEQESSSGDTELKPEAISKLMQSMIKAGDDSGKLKFWWHSHGDMSVFWSSTDDECAETLSREFAFSLVVNKKRHRKCRLDLYHPFRLTIDNVLLEEITEEDEALKKECKKEVEEKVKDSFIINRYQGHYYQDSYTWDGKWKNKLLERNTFDKLDISEELADDVIRLLELGETYQEAGGVWAPQTWDHFIKETIKEIVKEKFKSNINCVSGFGTYDAAFPSCKHCSPKKACIYWSNRWDKEEDELIEMICDTEEPKKDEEKT